MAILDKESDGKIVAWLRDKLREQRGIFRAKENRTLCNTNKCITAVYHVAEHISKSELC